MSSWYIFHINSLLDIWFSDIFSHSVGCSFHFVTGITKVCCSSPAQFDSLAVVQSLTSESLLQHHSSKASILWCSTFFMVQLLHLYTTQQTKLFFLHSLASCTSDFGSFPAQSEENSLTLSKPSRSTLG